MSAPKMPRHTCPTIDKLKARIEAAYKMADEVKPEDNEEVLRILLRDVARELCGEAGVLEDLRDANLGLRNCAEYWMAEAERLEAAIDA
jgi:hypothetical protein